jgi:nucleotidyltransferase substrate binding protein (TIGR01987 family)
MLDISSLDKALLSLNRAIVRAQALPQDEELRDAAIQRFEYCFELSWKMLKRRLERDVPTPASVDAMSFKELIREGFERGYVDNPEEWFLFREHRNTVAHTYDEAKAKVVFDSAVKLNVVARLLYNAIKSRNDG